MFTLDALKGSNYYNGTDGGEPWNIKVGDCSLDNFVRLSLLNSKRTEDRIFDLTRNT